MSVDVKSSETLDGLIEQHINPSIDSLGHSSVSSIVANANEGSLSVVEAIRQIGMQNVVTEDSSSDVNTIRRPATQPIRGGPQVKVARLSTGGLFLKEDPCKDIIQQPTKYCLSTVGATGTVPTAVIQPKLLGTANVSQGLKHKPQTPKSIQLQQIQNTNTIVPSVSGSSNQITIRVPDGEMAPSKIQDIVQLFQSGKFQLKPVSTGDQSASSGNTLYIQQLKVDQEPAQASHLLHMKNQNPASLRSQYTTIQPSTSVTSTNQNTVVLFPGNYQQVKMVLPKNPGLGTSYSQENNMDFNEIQHALVDRSPSNVIRTPRHFESPWQNYVKQFTRLGPCPICGDKISGYHYGIFCCESCKGFFKRTVQNGKQYTCPVPSQPCDIGINSRKKCPACRFDKCIEKGMRIDAIRLDRTRGGRSMYPGARNRQLLGDVQPGSSYTTGGGSSGDEMVYDAEEDGTAIFRNPSDASVDMYRSGTIFPTYSPSVSKKKSMALPKILADILTVERSAAGEDVLDFQDTEDETSVYRALLRLADERLYRIVRWSRNLPEFASVDTDDQILLLQNCWADLLCLDCCWKSLPTPKEIRLTAHKCINQEAARELGADEVVSAIMQLTQDLERLKLDITEYACIKVILLMTPDLKNLKATSRIRSYQEQVSQMLMEYTLTTYPQMANKFGELFLRIPELHRTSTMAREMLAEKDLTPYLEQNSLLMELLRSDAKTSGASGSAFSTSMTSVVDHHNMNAGEASCLSEEKTLEKEDCLAAVQEDQCGS